MGYDWLFYVIKPRQSLFHLWYNIVTLKGLFEHTKNCLGANPNMKVTILVILNVENIECLELLGYLNILTSTKVSWICSVH